MGRTSGATPSTAKSTPLGEGHMFKEGDFRRRAFLPIAAIGVAATQFGVFGTARAQSDQSKPDEDTTTSAVTTLPDHAPVPRSAMDQYATDGPIRRAPISDRRAATFSRAHSADTPAYPDSFWWSSSLASRAARHRPEQLTESGKLASHRGRLAHSVISLNGCRTAAWTRRSLVVCRTRSSSQHSPQYPG